MNAVNFSRIKRNLSVARFVLSASYRASPLLVVLILFSAIVEGLAPAVLVIEVEALMRQVAANANLAKVILHLVGSLTMAFIPIVLRPWREAWRGNLSDQVIKQTDGQIMRVATAIEYERFDDPSFYDTVRFTKDNYHLPEVAIWAVIELVRLTITAASVLAVLARVHLIALAIPLFMIPHAIAEYKMQTKMSNARWTSSSIARRADYFFNLLLDPKQALEIKHFGAGGFFLKRYRRETAKLVSTLRAARSSIAAKTVLAAVFHGLGIVAIMLALIVYAQQAAIDGVKLGVYLVSVIRLQQALWLFITIFGTWVNITHGYEKIMEFLKTDTYESGEQPSEISLDQPEYAVVFEHVYFRYPGSQEWALKDVSFRIKANECIALVGRNGSGKTTIVKLILGLYKPTKGRILYKRWERDPNSNARWQKTGVVFQDFCRFLLTLGENIEVGNAALADEVRRERAAIAAEKAGLAELIQKLPGGLDTQMGKVFGGVEVSTGQWQRIALARALMKDAYMMLFDEPTSALDPLIEAQVYELFRELSFGKTTVLVSHRLNSVMMADRILVIDDGVLVEQGTHDELLRKGGIYSRLYTAQSQSYLAGLSGGSL